MPKKIGLITILLIVLLFNVSTLANANSIKLKVNDGLVTNDLNYKLAQDDILIPLHVLTENLPLKMKWYGSIETIKLEYKDKSIKFRLGGTKLQVNNKLLNFSVAPYRENDQFMVPLKVLGEALGLLIRSNPEKGIVNIYQDHARITNISNSNQGKADGIKISVDQKVPIDSMFLQNPYRVVLDLKGTALYKKFKDFKVDSPLIKEVRMAQFNGNTVRVVLDLATKAKYEIEEQATGDGYDYLLKVTPLITGVNIDGNKVSLNSTAELSNTKIEYLNNPTRVVVNIKKAILKEKKQLEINNSLFKELRISQYKTEPNVVRLVIDLKRDIKFEANTTEQGLVIGPIQTVLEDVQFKNKLKLNLNKKIDPKVVFLESGSRLLIDFPMTITQLKSKKFNYDSDLIEEVRVSQYDQTTTRVVVDLVGPVNHQLNWNGKQWEVNLFNKLTAVNLENNEVNTKADLQLLAPGDYEVSRLVNPKRLVIDLPNVVVNKEEIKLPQAKGVIKKIRVSQYSTNPHRGRVVFELNESVNTIGNVVDNSLEFKLTKFGLAGKVITIDPGHGGKDPGALGYSTLREKKPVLDIGLKLEKLLTEAGAEVIMTRRKDEFISLGERVQLANKVNSDIFVSLHLNGHRRSSSFGTETFIAPNSNQQTKLLAQFIQDSLVDSLGTFDRGVKGEELYVLEHTNMPAVLEEIVFISNQKEEDKIMEEGFKNKSALAIYQGIIKYFELQSGEE